MTNECYVAPLCAVFSIQLLLSRALVYCLIAFRTEEGKTSDSELNALSIPRISKLFFFLLLTSAALFQVNDSVSYGMLIP